MNKIDEIYSESATSYNFSVKYIDYLCKLLRELDHKKVSQIIDIFLDAEKSGKNIFFIGNGGSASTAGHFACDFSKGTKNKKHMIKALSLVDNLSTLTAYANDEGYEYIFSRQLENLLNEGDIVVSISASGNSKNLINAINYSKTKGALTISLVGFDGGEMAKISDVVLIIKTAKGEYGPVEDAHMILDHLISNYLARKLN